MWKPLPSIHVLNLEGKPERESLKRTISASGRLGPLQRDSRNMQQKFHPKQIDGFIHLFSVSSIEEIQGVVTCPLFLLSL